jgi:hypothetical protein
VLLVGYSVCYLIIHLNSREDLTTLKHIKVDATYNSAGSFLTAVCGSAGGVTSLATSAQVQTRGTETAEKERIKEDIKTGNLEM